MTRFTLFSLALIPLVACDGAVASDKDTAADTADMTDTSDTADTNDTSDTQDTADTQDTSDTADTQDTGDTDDTGSGAYTGFDGTIEYRSELDGSVLCDADIAFTGTPFTGDCADCTFAFSLEGTITRDGSTSDCELNPLLSYVKTTGITDLSIVFWESFTYEGYYGTQTLTNLWGAGYAVEYNGYSYSGTQYIGASGYGNEMTVSGSSVSWEVVSESTDDIYEYPYGGECESAATVGDDPAGPVTDGVSATGSLDTTLDLTDVWEITVDGTADLVVTVDTVAADTAFDSGITLHDDSTCLVTSADDTFDCSFPYAYQCSGITIPAPTAGTWTVLVESYSAAGDLAEYSLAASGATALTLTGDDVDTSPVLVSSTTTTLNVTGNGTLR